MHKNNPLYGNCQIYCLLSDISMLNNLADELRMYKNVHNSVFIIITVAASLSRYFISMKISNWLLDTALITSCSL